MNSVLVELRPDRELLDPSFGGYKLSLNPVPIYRTSIPKGIDFLQPSEEQFSFFHVKVFSLHNHLYVNQHAQNNVYFVDKRWNIFKVTLDALNHLQELQNVCEIPSNLDRRKGHYNVSLRFTAPDTAVISDGAGTVHIANIIERDGKEKWEIMYSDALCNEQISFVIIDSRVEILDNEKHLHMILLRIEEKEDRKEEAVKSGLFNNVLEWITLTEDHKKIWTKQAHKKLASDGGIEYVALEPGCESVFIISDKTPKWIYDSENPIEEEKKSELEPVQKVYNWLQTDEEISISLELPKDTLKTDISVQVNDTHIDIKSKDTFVQGNFFHKVNKDLASWTYQENKLEVQLMKQEVGLMWSELIPGDKTGEEIVNPEVVKDVHERLAHLCSDKEAIDGQPSFNSQQLEDCDALSCDTTVFVRVNSKSHIITHEVNLSAFPWLFRVWCDPNQTPAICLRHDVDACVWQFNKVQEDTKLWPYKHTGTFFAFGYVQASKAQKKFLAGPPNLSYVAICEASRHIYIYRQPSAVIGDLRNRVSGRRVEAVAKQQLVNLEINEEILGVHATDSVLYVLTENKLHVLVINE